MNEVISAVAQEKQQPRVTFESIDNLVQSTVGARLFTITEILHDRKVAFRCYTNMPDAYPTTGEKPLRDDKWSEVVHNRHETFVANSIDEIAEVFPDYELIQSLGCESVLNLPIVIEGELRGTLNLLDKAGYFTAERVKAAKTLQTAGTLAILMAERSRTKGKQS
ncbi:GAF domain-containing protein [uncultured Maritalea sp.]|mgnify:CR=1 FL=1|uniref:GAF domain-containing protein n=1 Tax=uncultured Maritalea sp. TaxID=757249 RepID=UPI002636D365|nr:GAF domain-containing protein [uncultured Maritalea sp.]